MKALMMLGESTKFAVSGAVAVALVLKRDARTFLWVVGAVGAAVMNKILKRLINQARPTDAEVDPGMPSSHACSLWHLGTGVLLRLPTTYSPLAKLACCLTLVAYAVTSLRWRVYARYHTTPQVVVGALVGASTSVAWFLAAERVGLESLLSSTTQLSFAPVAALLAFGAIVVGSVERSKLARSFAAKRRTDAVKNKTAAE